MVWCKRYTAKISSFCASPVLLHAQVLPFDQGKNYLFRASFLLKNYGVVIFFNEFITNIYFMLDNFLFV